MVVWPDGNSTRGIYQERKLYSRGWKEKLFYKFFGLGLSN